MQNVFSLYDWTIKLLYYYYMIYNLVRLHISNNHDGCRWQLEYYESETSAVI